MFVDLPPSRLLSRKHLLRPSSVGPLEWLAMLSTRITDQNLDTDCRLHTRDHLSRRMASPSLGNLMAVRQIVEYWRDCGCCDWYYMSGIVWSGHSISTVRFRTRNSPFFASLIVLTS